MSWFDATGFANLAKSALKEAQKTIDKALDIRDDEQKPIRAHTGDTSDFFVAWGVEDQEDTQNGDKVFIQKQQNSSSIWGSFTGSFFETPKFGETNPSSKNSKQSKSLEDTSEENVSKRWLTSSVSLPEDLSNEDASESIPKIAAVVQYSEDDKVNAIGASNRLNVGPTTDFAEPSDRNLVDADKGRAQEATVDGKREPCKSQTINRVSIISTESDKKSCESVEILSSRSNTDCTTTPESDVNSISNSISPSIMGLKLGPNSESVEILPDSLVETSPSSVEILGDWKSDSSPYLSPMDPKHSESASTSERDESVTPCGEHVSDVQNWKKEEELNEDLNMKLNEELDQEHELEAKAEVEVEIEVDQSNVSSSDISPYESVMEDVKTPSANSYPENEQIIENSIPSSITFPTSRGYTRNQRNSMESLKISPESVEVIPDVDELDEVSLADDSYTSASEGTVMTIVETVQQFEQTKNILEFSEINLIPIKPNDPSLEVSGKQSLTQMNLSMDSIKEKHNLHLPLEPITTQPIRKSEHVETGKRQKGQIMDTTIEPSDPDKTETIEYTDQYLMLTDSSCEGTLIESSSEDNATLISTNKPKIIEAPLTASSYVKTMLADAMVEKVEIVDVEAHCTDVPRENSPISSESRSDLVKIGSDQTSGHTSGDELETTTSSDIEIISSPNGDSSSTQSRQSPAKLQLTKGNDLLTKTLKTRGHSRELSEISVGSDETNLEIEKLLKRIQEMTEILEARESKLIDVSRMNMELHEQNNSLKRQLDNFEKHAEQSQNINQITDEYTQRLSALERKFQQAIRERDSLRKNLELLKLESASRLSSQEICTINAEKDEIIKELREEGEKLSKQQLQHSNIIKKLRLKEKESDGIIKSQKEQIEEQSSELERLKRSLHAKEEVERAQIEAVHSLTAKTKKQEKEILSLQEKLDNALHKAEAYKRSLDIAKVDLAETKRCLVTAEEELKQATDHAGESCQLFAQTEDLKLKLRQAEEARVKKEEYLKHENGELLKRLEAAEARSEELSESLSTATKPLLRQLEQSQANFLYKSNNFMKQEKILSEKNADLQAKVENLIEMDRYLKEENLNLKSKVAQLESKLNMKETEKITLRECHDKLNIQNEKLAEQNTRYRQVIEMLEQSHSDQTKELKREISALENQLAVERAATDAERRKNHAILEQQQSVDDDFLRLSPTLSIGKESISSVNSIWPTLSDSVFDNASGRFPVTYETIRASSSSTSIFENLQAQLKQRDGEIQQLQWELSRRNAERDALNAELSTLTLKVEDLSNKISEAQTLNEGLNEIQTRYDALLQMYGEKVEENQELRLDLEDIKEMYKSQIDQLLKRDV